MKDFVLTNYHWFKALHIMAVISWMSGLLYLPRLFVYHAGAQKGSELSETFKTMEARLLRIVMNPAMAMVWTLGGCMLYANSNLMHSPWMHAKLGLVILLTVFHHVLGRWRKSFFKDQNTKTGKFYRVINEVPALAMIAIVILVVVKPF